MKTQMMLFSTPNSGSDWFAAALLAGNPNQKYFREFFNPITNDKYIDALLPGFGCEFISSYKNIARLDHKLCEQIYEETWGRENFDFTKENYSVFKIPFFIEKFRGIAITRQIENSFPARRRNEVYWWYECIYNSMVENIETLPKSTKRLIEISQKTLSSSIIQRILMGSYIYQKALINYCNEYEIPIIKWESLMHDDSQKVIQTLLDIPYSYELDIEAITRYVLGTRKMTDKNFNRYNFHPKYHLRNLENGTNVLI